MNRRIPVLHLLIPAAAICAAMVLVSLWAAPALGERVVPVHWNIAGEADNFAPASTVLIGFPAAGAVLAVVGLLAARTAAAGGLRPATFAALVIIMGVLAAAHLAVVLNGLGGGLEVPRGFIAGVGLASVVLGVLLARSGRAEVENLRGTRQPRADRRVTGAAYALCGAVLFVLSFAAPAALLPMAVVGCAIVPAVLAVAVSLASGLPR